MKIARYDLEGNLLEVLEGTHMADFCRQLDVEQTSLTRALNNYTITAGGFQYKNVHEHVKLPQRIGEVWHLVHKAGKNTARLIGKYYQGRLICVYRSLVEAEEKNIVDISAISRCLSGELQTTGGFSFAYLN